MRLRELTADELTPAAQRVWEAVTQGRRGPAASLMTPTGGLAGPFNALLYSPAVGTCFSALGEAIRYDTALDPRLRELATIIVGAHWRSNFEWAAHVELARRAGVSDAVIAALAAGEPPAYTDDTEAIVHSYVRDLLERGQVDDSAYDRAAAALGETGVVELTMVAGYYTLICFTLNAFRVPVPEGAAAPWA